MLGTVLAGTAKDAMEAKNATRGLREPDSETDRRAHEVIGAAIEVHRNPGPGHAESAYAKALALELGRRGVPFRSQSCFDVHYKGSPVGRGRIDFLVGKSPIVEVKAVAAIVGIHRSQVIAYLRATGHRLGLLINFNAGLLRDGIHRIVVSC